MRCARKGEVAVAIDGPSGVGKSTVSRLLAEKLNARYVDTGAMYRALALGAYAQGIEAEESTALENFLSTLLFTFEGENFERVILNGVDLTKKIREPKAGELASKYSALPAVRRRLVELQRGYAESGSVVMEGRDITTVVLPGADIKFFLTAKSEVRAKRRLIDEKSTDERGIEEVTKDIDARDLRDSTRKDSPLLLAEDAITIDTDALSVDEVVSRMMRLIDERGL